MTDATFSTALFWGIFDESYDVFVEAMRAKNPPERQLEWLREESQGRVSWSAIVETTEAKIHAFAVTTGEPDELMATEPISERLGELVGMAINTVMEQLEVRRRIVLESAILAQRVRIAVLVKGDPQPEVQVREVPVGEPISTGRDLGHLRKGTGHRRKRAKRPEK